MCLDASGRKENANGPFDWNFPLSKSGSLSQVSVALRKSCTRSEKFSISGIENKGRTHRGEMAHTLLRDPRDFPPLPDLFARPFARYFIVQKRIEASPAVPHSCFVPAFAFPHSVGTVGADEEYVGVCLSPGFHHPPGFIVTPRYERRFDMKETSLSHGSAQ